MGVHDARVQESKSPRVQGVQECKSEKCNRVILYQGVEEYKSLKVLLFDTSESARY